MVSIEHTGGYLRNLKDLEKDEDCCRHSGSYAVYPITRQGIKRYMWETHALAYI
jgi:hypothetical protein